MIIIVFGLPGSGKSYFSNRLARHLDAYYISSDILRKRIIRNPSYSEQEKILVYEDMQEAMFDHLHTRKHLVLDGTFYKAAIRNSFINEAEKLNKDILFIEVAADEALIKKRLQSARNDSDANFDTYKKIKHEFEPFEKEHLVLKSTNSNIEQMLARAVTYIYANEKKYV